MRRKKLNRFEKAELNRQKKEFHSKGKGKYLYKNNTKGSLILPKPGIDNIKFLDEGKTFIGDDYFMFMVRETNELRLVKVIESEDNPKEEEKMSNEKLILDQPDQITTDGKVEHVVTDSEVEIIKKNESSEKNPEEVQLINESPLEGIKIIKN
jgi:hypothetical protein